MTTQLRRGRTRAVPRMPGTAKVRPAASDLVGRLIRITLALYLVPALVAVVAVGAVGMLVLAAARPFVGTRACRLFIPRA